jgi:hypothetical protein
MNECANFWRWFRRSERRLLAFQPGDERTLDLLSDRLAAVHPDLTFEFGPHGAVPREFVLSAAGMKGAFPAVRALLAAAPPLPAWRLIAFRPRRYPISVVTIGGVTLDPDDIEVSLLHNGRIVGLHIFVPGLLDGDTNFGQAIYLLLDEALGEETVETHVGPIEILPFEANTGGPRFPLPELPRRFDRLIATLPSGA